METHLTPFNLFIAALVIFLLISACMDQGLAAVIRLHEVYHLFNGGKSYGESTTNERE